MPVSSSPSAVQKIPTIIESQSHIDSYDESLKTEDAVAEEIKTEPETLNLENIGRQMVEKALERNKGNRKKAAAELGISDRTLYRRIKQYGLECIMLILCVGSLLFSSCAFKGYSFSGASIDYNETKTITIADFPSAPTMSGAPWPESSTTASRMSSPVTPNCNR